MTWTRRLGGFGILLLATLGLLLCLGGIVGAWWAKSRVDAVGAAVFKAADKSFVFVDAKLELVKQGLGQSRSRVVDLSRFADRLKNTEIDVRQECQPLLQTLEDIHQELKWAESWLDSSQALADGLSQISAAALTSEFAAARADSTGVAVAGEVQKLSESVADTLARLQVLRAELAKLRETGVITRTVTLGIIDRVAVLDAKVADLGVRVDQLDAKVEAVRASFAEQDRKLKWWTLAATVAASLLPLWFAYSQIVVGLLGWRKVHPPATPPPPAP
jgi:hypothetical protein